MGSTHIMECNFFLHAFKRLLFISWLCSCTQAVSSLDEGELLIAVVSPVAKQSLQGLRASVVVSPKLLHSGPVDVEYRLSCPSAREIFSEQG